MTNKRLRQRFAIAGLVLLGLAVGAALWLAPAAQAAPGRQSTPVPTQLLMEHVATQSALLQAQAAQATPAPGGSGLPGAGSGFSGIVSSAVSGITQIFHIILFPFETMTQAVIKMANAILSQTYSGAHSVFAGALDSIVFSQFGIAPRSWSGGPTPLFTTFVRPHWNVTFAIALALLPATLTLTAVSAMRAGASSALGYADLKEALVGWLISAGAAAASYYLLDLAYRLSLAASKAILFADFGTQISGATLAGAFFSAGAVALLSALAPVIGVYVMLFVIFLASTVLLGLAMALAAYIALAYVLAVIAPVVIVLGALPPLRWLHSLWLKAITVAFLIPAIDALLLRAAVSLTGNTATHLGSGSLGGFIAGLLVTAGVISLLIALNYKVGEAVFGALAEVHRRAWESTVGVVGMALTAAGALAGYGFVVPLGDGGAGTLGAQAGGSPPALPRPGAGGAASAGAGGGAATPAGGMAGSSAAAAGSGRGPVGAGDGSEDAPARASGRDLGRATPSAALAGDPGLARRTAEVAGNASRALIAGAANPLLRSMGAGEATGAPMAEAGTAVPVMAPGSQEAGGAVGAAPAGSHAGDAGRGSFSSALPANPMGQRQAARLASGVSRALARASNPLLRSIGVGGMLGTSVGEARADAQPGPAPQAADHYGGSLPGYGRSGPGPMQSPPDGTAYPGALSDYTGEARTTLADRLARYTYAPHLTAAAVNDMVFDTLQRSGAGPQALRETYEIYWNQGRDPAAFAHGLQSLFDRHRAQPPADWQARAQSLFGHRRP